MSAAVRTLALLALLATAARSEDYDAIVEDYYSDPCEEEPREQSIAAVTASKESFRMGNKYYVLHGEDIFLKCSSRNAANLKIQYKENDLHTDKLNMTTIERIINKPNVGEYEYRCTDTKTGCGDLLNIIVEPVMSISSPRVRLTLNEHGERVYFVPYREDFEIFCTGNDFKLLKISTAANPLELRTETVNKTTIKYITQANHIGINHYYCVESESRGIEVNVDYYPEAQNFQCISYQWSKLVCSWRSSTKRNFFKLLDVRVYDGYTTLLCAFSSGEISRVCTTYEFTNTRQGVLQLETCNNVFCDYQTFPLDLALILKLDPPSDLKLRSTSSHGAVIAWHNPEDVFNWPCEFKIEYRFFAKEWLRANASSVPCDQKYCEFQLFLDCPDAHYEVRVYVKIKQATGDRFWSEPTSLYFFTVASKTGDMVNSACHAALQEPEPITSAETGLSEVGKLIRHTMKQKTILKKKLSIMKEKRDKIRAMSELISASN